MSNINKINAEIRELGFVTLDKSAYPNEALFQHARTGLILYVFYPATEFILYSGSLALTRATSLDPIFDYLASYQVSDICSIYSMSQNMC